MAKINSEIFREYDIRGIVDEDITSEFSFLLGKGFGTYAIRNGGKTIAISGDVRPSTEPLLFNLEKGLLSTGADVVKLGIIPSNVIHRISLLIFLVKSALSGTLTASPFLIGEITNLATFLGNERSHGVEKRA